MKFDTDHGINALHRVAAQYPYREHKFSTIRRDFVADPLLSVVKSEFKLDTTWCEHPESNRDALRGGF